MNQTIQLDPALLKQYSYLAKVSGPKPPFDRVMVRWTGDQVRLLAASDYLIATRTFDAETDEDGRGSGSVFIPASWWWTAFQGAAKAIGRVEEVNAQLIVVGSQVSLLVKEAGYSSTTTWERPARQPNWRRWLTHLEATDTWDGTLPRFNGHLLKTAVASLGLTKKELMENPIGLRSTGNGEIGAERSPMLLVCGEEWKCLLMPVVWVEEQRTK